MQAWTLTKAAFAAKMKHAKANLESAFALMPRPTNLRAQSGASFVALASAGPEVGSGIYALTDAGILVFMPASSRDLDRTADLKVSPFTCITILLFYL